MAYCNVLSSVVYTRLEIYSSGQPSETFRLIVPKMAQPEGKTSPPPAEETPVAPPVATEEAKEEKVAAPPKVDEEKIKKAAAMWEALGEAQRAVYLVGQDVKYVPPSSRGVLLSPYRCFIWLLLLHWSPVPCLPVRHRKIQCKIADANQHEALEKVQQQSYTMRIRITDQNYHKTVTSVKKVMQV